MDCNRVTIGIDPGVISSVVVTEMKSGKLLEAFEFKFPYQMELCQRMIQFVEKFKTLWETEIISKYEIGNILLEVPYSYGRSQKSYLYQREGKNGIDLVKLISTVFSIYQALVKLGMEVITVPSTYWLSNKEKFPFKVYNTQDLIDFNEYKQINKNRDGIVDATLMSYRYNHDYTLRERVKNFMEADFSKRKK